MHAIVSVVVTVATVMHFTFGCCLQGSHFGPATACHDCVGHKGDADACCMEHEHGHEHEADGDAAADDVSLSGEFAVRAGTAAAGHTCAGCMCTGAIEDDAAVRRASAAAPLATAVATVAVPASVARVDRARDRGGSTRPRDAHPLHERLLV